METEETLPFPPPLVRRGTPTNVARATAARHALARITAAPRSAPLSLEQLTEARLAELRNQQFLWETPAPTTAHEDTPAQTSRQIVLASQSTEESSLVPLRWRGMPVSTEFQVYALRVARGEDLAPYRGQILADPGLTFPWDAADVSTFRNATRRAVRVLLALAAFATLAAFALPNLLPSSPERIAAAAPAPSELAAPTPTISGPLVLEPALAPPPAAPPPAALPPVLASAPHKARAQGLTAPSAFPRVAATPSVAQRSTLDARKHRATTATPAPPGGEAAGATTLLVDRPSF